LAFVQKKSKTQNHPGISGIPGGFLEELALIQKKSKTQNHPGIPGIPGGFLVDSWRN
jgi:hypothetical protein